MADDKVPSIDDVVKEFQALKTHTERCKFFHLHYDVLATVFRPVHFPKPEEPAGEPAVTAG
jgi:hypothetical protein